MCEGCRSRLAGTSLTPPTYKSLVQDGQRAATVTVVDYGAGNLLSVARAFERVGATPT